MTNVMSCCPVTGSPAISNSRPWCVTTCGTSALASCATPSVASTTALLTNHRFNPM